MQTKEGQSNGISQSFSDDLVRERAIDSTMMTSLILLLTPSSGVNHIEHRVSKMDTLAGVAIKYGVKVFAVLSIGWMANKHSGGAQQVFIDREVLADLKAAGPTWVQFDEPKLVLDLDFHQLKAFTDAYLQMEESLSGLKVIVETYFTDVPAGAYKTIVSLKGISAIGFDLVRGEKTLELIKSLGFPSSKYLFAGVVDGRNIWANDLTTSLKTLKALESKVGKGL